MMLHHWELERRFCVVSQAAANLRKWSYRAIVRKHYVRTTTAILYVLCTKPIGSIALYASGCCRAYG